MSEQKINKYIFIGDEIYTTKGLRHNTQQQANRERVFKRMICQATKIAMKTEENMTIFWMTADCRN